MPTDRIAVLLGHADARMVERVYSRLDARQLGAELGRVFGTLELPAITVVPSDPDYDSRGSGHAFRATDRNP